jgi:hypothetical protein
MSNTITISFSKEDRTLLEGLMGSVTLLASVLGNAQPKEVQEKVIEEVLTPATVTAADPVEETPAPVAETTEEVKPVSLAEFQKAVTLAVSKGADAKKAVKAIINKYAASVSAVPEDKRAEVMAELATI